MNKDRLYAFCLRMKDLEFNLSVSNLWFYIRLATSCSAILTCSSHIVKGEYQVFKSHYLLGMEEAKIRGELPRSALLIPRLFALHNILKVSGYTSGTAWWPKQKLILFNGNVTLRYFHMYKLEHSINSKELIGSRQLGYFLRRR